MIKFSEWPRWVQFVVVFPHVLIGFLMFWVWWPKSDGERRRFGILAAYLVIFYLMMRFVFKA